MNATDLDRALAIAGLSAPVRWEEVTASTNVLAARLAEDDAPEWTLVGAGHQSAGRGRLGRSWSDVAGHALLVSVVLRPRFAADAIGLLSLLAGASWATAIRDRTGLDVRCKWPNDLVLADGKVGGVLAEAALDGARARWVVIGTGINLGPRPAVEGAASLVAEVDAAELLGGALRRFREVYRSPDQAIGERVVERWSEVSATLGRRVAAAGTDGRRHEGLAVAIDATGRLVVETADGRIAVASDEIEHLR